eukprot:355278-Chlamydomonas_euryale.AAC.2
MQPLFGLPEEIPHVRPCNLTAHSFAVVPLVCARLQAGDARLTDTRKDEQERGITIKSTGISLYYVMPDEDLKGFAGERDGQPAQQQIWQQG